jgi:AcrR family transcriptional regulator
VSRALSVPRTRPKENARRAREGLYRQLILDAAERIFAENGFDDAKIEEIAAASGLSLGTLYSVFAGKPDVMRAVHETRNREILERSAAAAEAAGPLEALLAAVDASVDFFVGHPDYLRIHLRGGHAWGLAGAGTRSRSQAHAWDEGIDLYSGIFERGIALGIFHPGSPRLLARMAIALQQVQLADWVEQGMQPAPAELVAQMHTRLRRAFVREAGDPADAPRSQGTR